MEKIDSFLEKIYGNTQSMMYFYIALGAIALFFIILIIITLIKSNKEIKAMKAEKEREEIKPQEEPKQEDNLSETKIFNNALMDKDAENYAKDLTPSPEIVKEVAEEPVVEEKDLVMEDYLGYEEEVIFDNPEKEEDISVTPDPVIEDISEMIPEVNEKPILEEAEIGSLEDATIEMPRVKPVDIDEYLAHREEVKFEPIKEEPIKEESIKLSNDELKSRIAKLKEQKQDNIPESDLEQLMKNVGLEDTLVIPSIEDEEKNILGQ